MTHQRLDQRVFLFSVILSIVCLCGSAQAEEGISLTTIATPKKVLIEQNMQLSEMRFRELWKVYQDYEIALDQIQQQIEDLIRLYAIGYRALTEDEAQSMIDKYFKIEKERIHLRESYVPKFKTVLSNKEVVRLYQIENKIESIIRFGLVNAIPLVNTALPPQETHA